MASRSNTLTIALLLAVALLVVACGGGGAKTTGNPPPPPPPATVGLDARPNNATCVAPARAPAGTATAFLLEPPGPSSRSGMAQCGRAQDHHTQTESKYQEEADENEEMTDSAHGILLVDDPTKIIPYIKYNSQHAISCGLRQGARRPTTSLQDATS